MRKVLLALAAVAAVGIALPVASSNADAREVIVVKHRNNGWHHGWRHRERVVVRHRDWHHHRSPGLTVRVR